MPNAYYEFLSSLRLAVGYLGEQQPRWWASNFFGPESDAFLSPVFPRTMALARYHGVVLAAAKVHDEHTGVGRLYHLFRLPEDLEHALHVTLQDRRFAESVSVTVKDRDGALRLLQEAAADGEVSPGEGPVRLGDTACLRDLEVWKRAAACYLSAFSQGVRVYPYFSDLR
jgi:hypothetical protein